MDATTSAPLIAAGRGPPAPPSPGLKVLQDAGIFLQTYFGGAMLLLGVVGNLLSIAVFMRKKMRAQGVTIFLQALGWVDLLFLVLGQGLSAWPDTVFDMRFIDHSRAACKIYYLVIPVLRQCSAWLIMGFSVERCMAIARPLQFRSIEETKKRRAILAYIATIFVASTLYNIHGPLLFDLIPSRSAFECDPLTDQSPVFITYVRPWVSTVLVTLIPFAVILGCNVIILREIRRSQKFRDKAPDDHTAMALMLLTVSFLFLVLSLPISLAMFLTRVYPPAFWYGSADARAKSDFMWKFSLFCLYLNSAVNFVCYVMNGRVFRAELRAMASVICPCLKKETDAPRSSSSSKQTENTNVV